MTSDFTPGSPPATASRKPPTPPGAKSIRGAATMPLAWWATEGTEIYTAGYFIIAPAPAVKRGASASLNPGLPLWRTARNVRLVGLVGG